MGGYPMQDHQMADILDRAMALGREKHPNAPDTHHEAFANSVAYAVTGWHGWYDGPSMREHYCSRLANNARMPSAISFDSSVAIFDEACYGPLTVEIAKMLVEENCSNDDPDEYEEALLLLRINNE